MALIVAGLFGTVLTDAYESYKKNADPENVLTNAVAEIVFKGSKGASSSVAGPFGVIDYITNQTNPAALKTTFRIYDDTWKMFSGKRSIPETIFGSQATLRSIQDSFKLWYKEHNQ